MKLAESDQKIKLVSEDKSKLEEELGDTRDKILGFLFYHIRVKGGGGSLLMRNESYLTNICKSRGGRPASTISRPSHILLIFSSEPP